MNKMKKTIFLSVLVNALEKARDGWRQFYNIATGQIESIPSLDNDYADTGKFQVIAKKINESSDYVELPTKRDLHEYDIMDRFAVEKNSDALSRALHGRSPFKTFKNKASLMGLTKEYYAFRAAAYAGIARDWCLKNDIPFTEEGEPMGTPITMILYYSGTNGAARRFAEEMESSGTAAMIRNEPGNLRYEYSVLLADEETVILIDSWQDQAALDAHHASPMMQKIAELREKYDLHMRFERLRAERYTSQEGTDDEFIRK